MSEGTLIVAMTARGAMGQVGQLPWHLPDDLKWFKAQTLGKTMMMGSKTFKSIGQKPLPGRDNWVLSHCAQAQADVRFFQTWQDMMAAAESLSEWVVIGGAALYRLAIPHVSTLIVTWVDMQCPDADVFFPQIDWDQWMCQSREAHTVDARHACAFEHCIYRRDRST